MSDCFDHYMDAYEQDEAMGGCGFGFGLGDTRRYRPRKPREVMCRSCGSTEVFFSERSTGNWSLFDKKDGKRHVCPIGSGPEGHPMYRRRK